MRHAEKVSRIAQQLKEANGICSMNKGGVSHMLPLATDPRAQDRKVDLRGLDEILSIDPLEKVCTAEPGVTFFKLVQETLKHGLAPRLVPELKTITLGGAVSGCSVESTSFRWGGFHDSALAYEMVTGKGEVLHCTPTENAEIFQLLHGSYGTLGVLTSLTFPLMEAKPFVHLTYPKYSTFESFYAALQEACASGKYEFIDAIIHQKDRYVLCLGNMVEQAPYHHRYEQSIFYRSTWKRDEDYLPIVDYFFRYDADCHWLSRKIPGLENPIVRRLAGKHLLSSTNLLKLSKRAAPLLAKVQKRPDVVLDCFLPASRFAEFFRFLDEKMPFYPLWIVPYRIEHPYPFLADGFARKIEDTLFIDCAIYGKENKQDVDLYTLLEEKLFELGGLKALIARNTYPKERFWEIYHRERYLKVKESTDPSGRFRDLYDKVHCRG